MVQNFLTHVSHVSVCLSVCLSVCSSICLFVCMSVCLFVCRLRVMSACLYVFCLSVRPSVCPSVRLSACPSVCLSVRLSVCLSVRRSVCLYVCLSVCLFVCRLRLMSRIDKRVGARRGGCIRRLVLITAANCINFTIFLVCLSKLQNCEILKPLLTRIDAKMRSGFEEGE